MTVSIWEISLLIIAFAFVILVIYLIQTLKSVQHSAEQMNQSIIHIQQELDQVGKETTELLRNTNMITLDLQEKVKSFDSIFHSIENVGQCLQQVTYSAKQVSSTFSGKLDKGMETMQKENRLDELIKVATLGLSIWQKIQGFKKRKQEQ